MAIRDYDMIRPKDRVIVAVSGGKDSLVLLKVLADLRRAAPIDFEILPLHIKMAVIEEGIVLWSRDVLELYEYFYPFRREWDDQKHRHDLSPGEMRELIAAARRARKGGGTEGIVEG